MDITEYSEGNWESERLSDLPSDIQQVRRLVFLPNKAVSANGSAVFPPAHVKHLAGILFSCVSLASFFSIVLNPCGPCIYHLCQSCPLLSHQDQCTTLLPGLSTSAHAPLESVPNTQADEPDWTLAWKSHFIPNKSGSVHKLAPSPHCPSGLICHCCSHLLTLLQLHWFPCCLLNGQGLCASCALCLGHSYPR